MRFQKGPETAKLYFTHQTDRKLAGLSLLLR